MAAAAAAVHPDLAFALELADLADEVTMSRFRSRELVVSTKPDLTPVTEADRRAEETMRGHIAQARPADSVLGEEFGVSSGGAGPDAPPALSRWILDPIDGTKNYIRGVPVWGTLIALEREGSLVVGVVSAPALGRRWWAARGEGAFAGPCVQATQAGRERIQVSSVGSLDDAFLSWDNLRGFEKQGRGDAALELERRCWRTRGLGDFWSHVLVAEGAVDVATEPEVSLWDLAALKVIVEEAGGRFTDLEGRARADGGSVVSTNGHLHDEVLAVLGRRA